MVEIPKNSVSVPVRLTRITLLLLASSIGDKKIDDANFVSTMQAVVDCAKEITEDEFIALDQAELFRFLEECKGCLLSEEYNSVGELAKKIKGNLDELLIDDCVNSPC